MLPERAFKRLILPMVSLAAGSLLGGALFHMLPTSVDEVGNTLAVYVWLAPGIFSFFVLEQYLHWHHCHRPVSGHRPLGHLILVADGLHNLIGGLAVGSAFVVDTNLGIVTWLVAAAHEVPQELGDFGIHVRQEHRNRRQDWKGQNEKTVLYSGSRGCGFARPWPRTGRCTAKSKRELRGRTRNTRRVGQSWRVPTNSPRPIVRAEVSQVRRIA